MQTQLTESSPSLFEATGVAMPPRPRPRRTDKPVLEVARRLFAADALKNHKEVVGDATEDDIVRDMEAVARGWHEDAAELADDMKRRGYSMSLDLVAMMERWSDHLHGAHDAALAAWIGDTKPEPPFTDVARAVVTLRGVPKHGVAYLPERQARVARCLFVPDDETARFAPGETFKGGAVVDWEDLKEVGPATVEDTARFEATREEERRRESRERLGRFVFGRENAFDATVKAEAAAAKVFDDAALEAELRRAVDDVARDMGPGFDHVGREAARLVALTGVARARSHRAAFAGEAER